MLRRAEILPWFFRSGGAGLIAFSVVTNLLLLVPSLYMLQIYDRVLASGSLETLLLITLIATAALALLAFIDVLRGLIAGRIGARLTAELGAQAFTATLSRGPGRRDPIQPIRDLSTVSGFLAGRNLLTLLDLPFAPIFLALLYLLHPLLFWSTLGGAVLLSLLAIGSEKAAKWRVEESHDANGASLQSVAAFARAGDTVRALGMTKDALAVWGAREEANLRGRERLDRTNALYAGASRWVRLILQISVIGLGGYLTLAGQISGGMIFAASLLSGRALLPIDALIGGWKQILDARSAYRRLRTALEGSSALPRKLDLPELEGRIDVEALVAGSSSDADEAGRAILRRVSFAAAAGERIAVIGPSGAGKSTLARALVGIVPPLMGHVRLDGNELANFDEDFLGRRLGYLAQDVDLLPGTVAQNIARFRTDCDDRSIVAAAKRANAHEMILRLPDGYGTMIETGLHQLSGGQRQRVGLARAFFGEPKLIVLDEPNAHLDSDGEAALESALASAREDGITTVVVTQRRTLAERSDKVLVLREGTTEAFSDPASVLGLRPVAAAPYPVEVREGGDVAGAMDRPEVLRMQDRLEDNMSKEAAHGR